MSISLIALAILGLIALWYVHSGSKLTLDQFEVATTIAKARCGHHHAGATHSLTFRRRKLRFWDMHRKPREILSFRFWDLSEEMKIRSGFQLYLVFADGHTLNFPPYLHLGRNVTGRSLSQELRYWSNHNAATGRQPKDVIFVVLENWKECYDKKQKPIAANSSIVVLEDPQAAIAAILAQSIMNGDCAVT